jgi:single-stranded-DNA-specific exonuclease
LLRFGGHHAAAGVKVRSDRFDAFAERFDAHCRSVLTAEHLRKEIVIDAEVPLGVLTVPLLREVEKLEPFGIGNPKPLLLVSQARIVSPPKHLGSNQEHLKFVIEKDGVRMTALAWNMKSKAKSLYEGGLYSFAFHPSLNQWNGRHEVQIELKEFETAEAIQEEQLARVV